jgi:hypothetical protein
MTEENPENASAMIDVKALESAQSSSEVEEASSQRSPCPDPRIEDATTKKRTLIVSFSQVAVYEHAITLGDSPACMSGPPITISWTCSASHSLNIDEYERLRPARRDDIIIPETARIEMLRNAGFSRQEIVKGTRAANVAREQRKQTRQGLASIRLHEAFETMCRGVLKVVSAKRRKEKAWLDKHMIEISKCDYKCNDTNAFDSSTRTASTDIYVEPGQDCKVAE